MKKTIRSGPKTNPISLEEWTRRFEDGTLTDAFLQSRGYIVCFDHDPSSPVQGETIPLLERDFNTEIRCGTLVL